MLELSPHTGVLRGSLLLARYEPYGRSRLTECRSPGATGAFPLSLRFRSRALLVRICRLPALCRSNFPPPVRLNRLLAPLWVFSLSPAISFPFPDVSANHDERSLD